MDGWKEAPGTARSGDCARHPGRVNSKGRRWGRLPAPRSPAGNRGNYRRGRRTGVSWTAVRLATFLTARGAVFVPLGIAPPRGRSFRCFGALCRATLETCGSQLRVYQGTSLRSGGAAVGATEPHNLHLPYAPTCSKAKLSAKISARRPGSKAQGRAAAHDSLWHRNQPDGLSAGHEPESLDACSP